MKKVLIYISLALLAIIIIPIAFIWLRVLFDLGNPMRKPAEQIRENILTLTPIGMDMDDVVKVVEENGWKSDGINNRVGVIMGELGRTGPAVGVKSIRATIGGYANFFNAFVDVYWAFDEDSKLIEIFVKKTLIGF